MAKRKIELCDCAGEIVRALRPGILITTKAGGKVNSMTIGWGTLGIIWNRPVFIAYVRDCRYTREMLDKNPEFTINVPVGDYDRNALGLLGSKSGRDMDKIAAVERHRKEISDHVPIVLNVNLNKHESEE